MQPTIKKLWVTMAAFGAMSVALAQSCESVEARGINGGTRGSVPAVGNYCLNVDLDQPRAFDIHSMSMRTFQGAALLSIVSPAFGAPPSAFMETGLDIHLQGHQLEATAKNMIGIKTNTAISHVRVAYRAERTTFALEEVLRALPARARDYPARGILVEKVAISSAGWGIGVEGAGTVIRDSTIEVDAGTALWIYGPHARIENNTIIVRGRGRVREADAPIRLHHGDGAIIRNNRIVVKGDGHPWAITSFRTGAITLEGNTMNGKPVGPEGIRVFADDLFQLTETTGVL